MFSADETMSDNECHRCSAGKDKPVARTCDEEKEVSKTKNVFVPTYVYNEEKINTELYVLVFFRFCHRWWMIFILGENLDTVPPTTTVCVKEKYLPTLHHLLTRYVQSW